VVNKPNHQPEPPPLVTDTHDNIVQALRLLQRTAFLFSFFSHMKIISVSSSVSKGNYNWFVDIKEDSKSLLFLTVNKSHHLLMELSPS
jgi:hypothetical protein